MLVLHLFGSCPKIHATLALVHKKGVLCIIWLVAKFLRHQAGYTILTQCSVYWQSHGGKMLSHLHYGIKQFCWQ